MKEHLSLFKNCLVNVQIIFQNVSVIQKEVLTIIATKKLAIVNARQMLLETTVHPVLLNIMDFLNVIVS